MGEPEDPDAADVAAWRSGDRAAGEALFDRHFDAMFRFFRNKVDDGIDDLIQQTFAAVVGSIDRFRGDSTFRTYLYTIARHELLAHWRKRARHRGDVDVTEISVAEMSTAQPSRVVARRREHERLLEALRTLPLDLQIALELAYWEEMTGPELAAALGLPEGTARSRLRRAKELLAEKIELDERLAALG